MRSGMIIVMAGALAWVVSYLGMQLLDINLKHGALLICATFSALYAAGMVIMGENLLEDVIKVLLVTIPTGVILFSEPRFAFLFVCALSAGGFGMLFNSLDRLLAKRKLAAS